MREGPVLEELAAFSVEKIIEDVRVLLDLNDVSESFLEPSSDEDDIETLTLDEIIESKIADAARVIVRAAPLRLCGNGKAFGSTIAWESGATYSSGYVQLPSDFMRLISFQMSDWKYAVHTAITEDDAQYAQQHGDFAGLRGNPERPVVALVEYPVGLALEFYSCKTTGASVKRARYIPYPAIKKRNVVQEDEEESGALVATTGKTIELPGKLLGAIEHYAAYLSATAIAEENAEKVKGLMATAMQLAEIEDK